MMSDLLYRYRARVTRIIDGDTVKVEIDLGLSISATVMIRLYGINAPEMRGVSKVQGDAAKLFLGTLIPLDGWVQLKTFKDSKEKYGRYLGVVTVTKSDGSQLIVNDEMVRSGHAVVNRYDGSAAPSPT